MTELIYKITHLAHTVKVHTSSGSSYYVSRSQATAMVNDSHAEWISPSDLREHPQYGTGGKLGQWCKIQSGLAGPQVMQLI